MGRIIKALLIALLAPCLAHGQTQITGKIQSTAVYFIEGNGAPSGTCNSSFNYGAVYFDNVNLVPYFCANSGWLQGGSSSASGAPLASPAFTGVPTAPTAAPGTNTTQLSTTAYVVAALGSYAALATANTFTAAITDSVAGAASTPALLLTGAPYTAGTGTTNFPLLYLNDGTATTTLSTAGTEIGINAPSGFTGMMIDARVNGAATAAFSVNSLGDVSGRTFTVGNTLLLANGAAASAATTSVLIQGGQDTTSTNPGTLTLRGANVSSGTNAASSVGILAGKQSGTGQQGGVSIQHTFTTASALAATNEVVAITGTDQVGPTALGGVNSVGIAQTVGGSAVAIYVVTTGKTGARFDGTPVVGDVACGPPTSTGTVGLAHDNGTTACPSGQKLGVVTGQVSGTGSGATATILVELAN